jgi:hypothetical protein
MRREPAVLASALFLTVAVTRAESAPLRAQTIEFTKSSSRPNPRGRVEAFRLGMFLLEGGAVAQGHAVEAEAIPQEGQAFGPLSNGVTRESAWMLLLGAALLFLGGIVRRHLARKDSFTKRPPEPVSIPETPQSPVLPESLSNLRHSRLVRAPVRIVRAVQSPQAGGSKERVDAPTKALRDPRFQRSPDVRRARALDN